MSLVYRPDHPMADEFGMVEKAIAGARNGSGPAPMVISDTMSPLIHPITGKPMDSKSAFRAVTRAHNCVEVGNEVQRDTRKMDFCSGSDVARAIRELGG